jgi:hypothetical protein
VLVTVPPMIVARLAARDGIDVRVGLVLVMAFTLAACWFLPRRTIAGARTLRALRSADGHLPARGGDNDISVQALTPEQIGLAVALNGTLALLARWRVSPEKRVCSTAATGLRITVTPHYSRRTTPSAPPGRDQGSHAQTRRWLDIGHRVDTRLTINASIVSSPVISV